ncbi:MAG: hypothetical protein GQ572_03320 [Gammaproteobacteria bacterium]|nr:hypothetical protein [Gammaproteobacteria bacterium]
MDSRKLKGLCDTVLKFKSALNDTLKSENGEFHVAVNGDKPLMFEGLTQSIQDDPNSYSVEISDLLFWHDPEAYMDEMERWEGQQVKDQHVEMLEYLEESEQSAVFSKLVETIKKKRIAPFVGAGLSKSCNFPLWGEAIEKLVNKLEGVSTSEQRAAQPALAYLEEVKQQLSEWHYLEAVELLYTNSKTHVDSFVRNTFELSANPAISGPVKLLPKICDGCIVTTNFDEVIETVFIKDQKPIEGYMHGTQTQHQFVAKLIQGERCILKLHGTVNDPETYILSEAQYNDAYGHNASFDYTRPLAKTLRQIFVSHSLLFLGCSLEQDRTLGLFQDVVDSKAFDIPDHFAFLPKPSDHEKYLAKEELLMQAKIRPIWYQAINGEDGISDHSGLEKLLKLAIDITAGRTRI